MAITVAISVAACSDDVRTTANDGAGRTVTPLSRGTQSTLVAGTTLRATIQDSISSTRNRAGQVVNAIVSLNVVDAAGHTVIPGGAAIQLTIAQLRGATSAGDGVITLTLTSLLIEDSTYSAAASVGAVAHTMNAGATATASREIVATPGTPILITLTHPLTIAAS